ncbi:MAG: hypothetical protein QOD92_1519 [Acidimicrobiaceae bacterium]|jgi:Kef-type K+ transport system membrane component KefB/predicted amino acid-binding ACT domain protein
MDLAHILRDILVVLVAAKVAAELAERIGVPAVVGEIVAGILIGPSLLGLVGNSDDVLRTLGEIGVILLLLDVGLEMDLAELGKVGRASMLVAIVGVVTPMVLGIGVMELIGDDFKTSLFVGAALTATSVGITARVFGDLHALATTEARIVLGAAVADDVMGLVVLTVVVRIVTQGSVSALSVAGIVLVAVGFLAVGGLIGLRLAPPLFALVDRVSRSTGTLVALALAFTLGFAQLADAAQLAPIVGAFVAGIALSRSAQSDRIRRELAPVGHLFIPVFFLQIGIDARIEAFGRIDVLRDAALLLVVAVVGKLVSPIGAIGTHADKVLVGLGMLPRGEVGLIFATIGLQSGVLDQDLYAALLLVVLVTTLGTPQLLKLRYARLRRDRPAASSLDPARALRVALDAAIVAARQQPPDDVVDQLANLPEEPLPWDDDSLNRLLDVIERGNARSWRFLEMTGVLDRALPEVAETFRERRSDAFSIDPLEPYRLASMERLRSLDVDDPLVTELRALHHIDRLLLAAFLADVRNPGAVLRRLGVEGEARDEILALIADRDLLWSAARQPGGLGERAVLELASHLDTPERARALYVLSALRDEGRERWEIARLRELYDLVQMVLRDSVLTGIDTRNLIERRRADAMTLVEDPAARARIEHAPRSYLLRQTPGEIARHAALLNHSHSPQIDVIGADRVDVGTRDQPGLLAAITGALADAGVEVDHAEVATWSDGAALESFRIRGPLPDRDRVAIAIAARLRSPLESEGVPDAEVSFDSTASPWHTICEVQAADRPGLLHALASALAAARVEVRSANVTVERGGAINRFEVVNRDGAKLTAAQEERVSTLIASGVTATRRRKLFSRTRTTGTGF